MFKVILGFISFFLLMMVFAPVFAKEKRTSGCQAGTEIFAEMAETPQESYFKVPKDLKIDQKSFDFMIISYGAMTYNLPIKSFRFGTANLKPKYGDHSTCKVQDDQGNWWLVIKNASGNLEYVLEAETEKVSSDYKNSEVYRYPYKMRPQE